MAIGRFPNRLEKLNIRSGLVPKAEVTPKALA
jgi:hypothetical protein